MRRWWCAASATPPRSARKPGGASRWSGWRAISRWSPPGRCRWCCAAVSATVACSALRRWAGSWRVAPTCEGWVALLTAVRAGYGTTPLPVTVVPQDLVAVPPTILPPPGEIEVQGVLVRRALAPWLAAVRAAAEVIRARRLGAREPTSAAS